MPGRQRRASARSTRVERRGELVAREVEVAPVALGPASCRGAACPVRLPSSNGTRAMTDDAELAADAGTARPPDSDRRRCRRPARCRRRPCASARQDVGRLPAVDADAERANQAFALEIVDRALPARRRRPTRRTTRGTAADRRTRVRGSSGSSPSIAGCDRRRRRRRARSSASAGHFKLPRRDLRGDDEPLVAMTREHAAEQLLALALAVGERGVEERAAELDRRARAPPSTRRRSSRTSRPCPTNRNRPRRRGRYRENLETASGH